VKPTPEEHDRLVAEGEQFIAEAEALRIATEALMGAGQCSPDEVMRRVARMNTITAEIRRVTARLQGIRTDN
jgi:hypothetical protein